MTGSHEVRGSNPLRSTHCKQERPPIGGLFRFRVFMRLQCVLTELSADELLTFAVAQELCKRVPRVLQTAAADLRFAMLLLSASENGTECALSVLQAAVSKYGSFQ